MSKLTYEDLSNFTHDELSNLTHCDLALDKLELISKSENGTIVLPDDILEKIKQLSDEVSKLPEFQEKNFKHKYQNCYRRFSVTQIHF